jgi:hypothetical protein
MLQRVVSCSPDGPQDAPIVKQINDSIARSATIYIGNGQHGEPVAFGDIASQRHRVFSCVANF